MIFRIVVGLWISLMVACTSVQKQPPKVAPFDAKKELSQISLDVASGNDKKAIQRLKNLIQKYPNSDLADDASYQLAQLHFKRNEFDLAYKTYMSMVESDVFSPNEANALLGASRSLHKLGRLDEALALNTRGLKIAGLSDTAKLEMYRHRYSLLSATGDRVDALRSLAFIFEKDPKPEIRNNAQARAMEIVNFSLQEADLEKVVREPSFGFVRGPAAYRLALFRLKQKDFDGARGFFANAAEWSQGTPVEKQAQSYILQLDSRRKVDPYTIGAELPLTGKYAPIAQKTLRGLQLGLGIYGPDRSDFRLAVVDSEGTPDGARKSVERLVTEDNVIAIVGSLLSRTAPTVVSKAEELGVPSITLSQKSGLTESGTYIFRNAVTSEMQVKELVKLAMDQLGLRRFAILYPNEPYGVEYANLFWDEVLARGGQITGAQTYSSAETDFRGPIKRLVGTFYLDDRKTEYQNRVREWFKKQKKLRTRQSPPDDILPPVVDFEAIFIPDGPKAIGQIGPMLAYQGVQNVRLLGTNVWNTTDLVRRGQKTVESALFVDLNLVNDPSFKSSKFYRDYMRTFGEEPGLFEAQGYEVGLLLRQVIAGGDRTRVGLAQTLTTMGQFQGVSGTMTMNTQRELVRPLTPYVVRNSEIIAWNPTLESQLSNDDEPSEPPPEPKSAVRPGPASRKRR